MRDFVEYCESMMIVNESKFDDFKKHAKNRKEARNGVSILKKALMSYLKENNIPYKRISFIPKTKRVDKGGEFDRYEGEIRLYLKNKEDKNIVFTSDKFTKYVPSDTPTKITSNWTFGYDEGSPYLTLSYAVAN